MANPFCHIELSTDDVVAAKKFYQSIFGWKISEMPMGDGSSYYLIDVGEGTGGGMMKKPMPEAPTMWMPYVLVDDAKKTVAKARKNGAHVIIEYHEVPGMGAFGIFIDPTGAAIAVWQPAPPARAKAKPAAASRKKAAAKPAAKSKAAANGKAAAKAKPAGRKAGAGRSGRRAR